MRIRFNLDKIDLKTLNKSASDLAKNYIYNIDSFIMLAASILMGSVNLFWMVRELFVKSPQFKLLTHVGIIIGIAVPIITILYLLRRNDDDYSLMRPMVFLFHLSVIISTTCLNMVSSSMDSASGGISLALFWLFICTLIPMVNLVDSIVIMGLLVLSTFVPQALVYGPQFVSTNPLLVAICIVFAYFGFRLFAISNSRLIQKLAFTSYRDHQTGTLNKRALYEYLEGIQYRDIKRFGVLIYDIDDLRAYNYKYNHVEGDKMLLKVNDSVMDYLKTESALVFRHGGGEFVAIIEDITDERLLKVALKVKETVENLSIERNDGSMRPYVTVTVGCASTEKNQSSTRDILSEADTQLYIGKEGTKNCVVFNGRIYVAEGEITNDEQPTPYTERVAQAVSEAIRRKEMKVYFQPLYDTTTQNMVGAEALSRWEKPDGNIILPSEYIPELEKNSSILALDWFMYEETCRVIKNLKDMGIPAVMVSVNFSRMHALYERDIDRRLSEIADSYSISHNLIEIEITESAYLHFPSVMEPMIRSIRAAGFAVAVDDFGSGASSLEFINSVDVDTLKIDKSLISSNCSDEKERVLLESVVLLAHRLQLNSVAEGVETMEQLGFLKTIGCKQVQGFIFSKPLPENEYYELCKNEAAEHKTFENVETEGTASQSSMQMLLDTVFKEYPTVIISNISKDSYYTMTYENFTDHKYPQAGALTSLLEEICSTIIPNERDEFMRVFSLKNQVEEYNKGVAKFEFTATVMGDSDKSNTKTIKTLTYFIKEIGSDDLLAVTLCSESGLG